MSLNTWLTVALAVVPLLPHSATNSTGRSVGLLTPIGTVKIPLAFTLWNRITGFKSVPAEDPEDAGAERTWRRRMSVEPGELSTACWPFLKAVARILVFSLRLEASH